MHTQYNLIFEDFMTINRAFKIVRKQFKKGTNTFTFFKWICY